MGVVYKAYQRSFQRVVAVKAMRAALNHDRDGMQRFLNEARALATLNHPNIVRTYSLGTTRDKQPYIIMEFIEGQTLAQLMSDGTLPVPRIVDLFGQLLDGLQHAHSLGCIHRDLKPTNVMVTTGGVVKIMDFGIAKSAFPSQSVTGTGEVLGSPAYMSPEQARSLREADTRSDLYSVAAMLFEALEGKTPFQADGPVELLLKLQVEPPPAVTRGSPRLRELVQKGLAKEPDARCSTAAQMKEDLIIAAADARKLPAHPSKSGKPKRPRMPRARLVAAVLCVPLVATAWYIYDNNCRLERDKLQAASMEMKAKSWKELLDEIKLNANKIYRGELTPQASAEAEKNAFALLAQAEKIAAEQHYSPQNRFTLLSHRGSLLMAIGQPLKAAESFEKGINLVNSEDPRVRDELSLALQLSGRCRMQLRQYPQALADYKQAEQLYDKSTKNGNQPDSRALLTLQDALLSYYSSQKEFATCLEYAKKQYAEAKRMGIPEELLIRRQKLGYYLCQTGDCTQGLPLLQQCVRALRDYYAKNTSLISEVSLARALADMYAGYRLAGRSEDAQHTREYLLIVRAAIARRQLLEKQQVKVWAL